MIVAPNIAGLGSMSAYLADFYRKNASNTLESRGAQITNTDWSDQLHLIPCLDTLEITLHCKELADSATLVSIDQQEVRLYVPMQTASTISSSPRIFGTVFPGNMNSLRQIRLDSLFHVSYGWVRKPPCVIKRRGASEQICTSVPLWLELQ